MYIHTYKYTHMMLYEDFSHIYIYKPIYRFLTYIFLTLVIGVQKQFLQAKEWDFKYGEMDFPSNHKSSICSV